MSTAPSQIYQHRNTLETLVPLLSSHLPNTLCLLRRLQFHCQPAHARIFATFPPGNQPDKETVWSIAFVDRSAGPETQCWVLNSLELLVPPVSGSVGHRTSLPEDQISQARVQLLALLTTIRDLDVPDVPTMQEHPHILIMGCVHEATLSILTGLSVRDLKDGKTGPVVGVEDKDRALLRELWTPVTMHGPVLARSGPWLKFLFKTDISPSSRSKESVLQGQSNESHWDVLILELGLEWTMVRHEEFALVKSRTSIPRQDRTLALLPSTGLRRREDGKLVAWAFLGVDGGLTTLHVEEEYRGKGLGKAVSRRVLKLLGDGLVDGKGFRALDDEISTGRVWSYSHTALDNVGSIGVAKALGGQQACIEYWVMVDLQRVDSR